MHALRRARKAGLSVSGCCVHSLAVRSYRVRARRKPSTVVRAIEEAEGALWRMRQLHRKPKPNAVALCASASREHSQSLPSHTSRIPLHGSCSDPSGPKREGAELFDGVKRGSQYVHRRGCEAEVLFVSLGSAEPVLFQATSWALPCPIRNVPKFSSFEPRRTFNSAEMFLPIAVSGLL